MIYNNRIYLEIKSIEQIEDDLCKVELINGQTFLVKGEINDLVKR